MHVATARTRAPSPVNEPVQSYAPGTPEKAQLKAELARQWKEVVEGPMVIGGERVRTGHIWECTSPHAPGHVLARLHEGGPAEVGKAVAGARAAGRSGGRMAREGPR